MDGPVRGSKRTPSPPPPNPAEETGRRPRQTPANAVDRDVDRGASAAALTRSFQAACSRRENGDPGKTEVSLAALLRFEPV